jgi:endonuclease/exonuclease/phosphatase family metal-dependent hydrolase
VRFATYNIHFGVGRDGGYDLARIADAVASADLIALQEVVVGWPQNAYADQAAEIAARLNYYVVYHAPFEADSSEVGADGRVINRRRSFGNAILSRFPIIASRGHLLPKRAAPPGEFDLQRGAVEAVVETPEGPVRAYSVHFSHLSPQQRMPQVEALAGIVAEAPEHGAVWDGAANAGFAVSGAAPQPPRTCVVMGDLNFTPACAEYPRLCAGLLDAWVLAGGAADAESFPAEGRIDHCLVSRDLAGAVRGARIDTTAQGSDHWPLLVDIDLAARAP